MDFFDFFGLFSKAFSGETIDFCEKSFCTAVSMYNISHMTPMTHTFEKKEQPYCIMKLILCNLVVLAVQVFKSEYFTRKNKWHIEDSIITPGITVATVTEKCPVRKLQNCFYVKEAKKAYQLHKQDQLVKRCDFREFTDVLRIRIPGSFRGFQKNSRRFPRISRFQGVSKSRGLMKFKGIRIFQNSTKLKI